MEQLYCSVCVPPKKTLATHTMDTLAICEPCGKWVQDNTIAFNTPMLLIKARESGEQKEMKMEMTQAQFDTAWKLASAFDHEWSKWTKPADDITNLDEIARRSEEHSFYLGIHAPTVEWDIVTHTTGSGRLKWVVFTNGQYVITVNRPQDGEVMRYDSKGVPNLTMNSLARERHAETLIKALTALGEQVPQELRGLRDIGGGEALRRLARIELLPMATSSAIADVWSRHHERQLARERYSAMYPEDITTAKPEAVPVPVPMPDPDYTQYCDPTEGLLAIDECDLPAGVLQ